MGDRSAHQSVPHVEQQLARWAVGLVGVRIVDVPTRTARLVWVWSDYDSALEPGAVNVRLDDTSWRWASEAGGLIHPPPEPGTNPAGHLLFVGGMRPYSARAVAGGDTRRLV